VASGRVMIVAGEASGDLHGAALVREAQGLHPELTFSGVAGPLMRRSGVEALFVTEKFSAMGFLELAGRLGHLLRAQLSLRRLLKRERWAALVLIDFADFNLRLAAAARRAGVPVLYYISPKVWAWRQGRIKTIKRLVDRMAVIFPFEEELYARAGVAATFVGHPLLDSLEAVPGREKARQLLGLGPGLVVALLPGSRPAEIERILPVMVAAARLIERERPGCSFVLPVAPTLSSQQVRRHLQEAPQVSLASGAPLALSGADVAIVCSGTATLEAAILQRPMVVVYRGSALSYQLARRLVRVPYISLPNLVAGEPVVPELIQEEATPERIARETLGLLAESAPQLARLAKVRQMLGRPGAARRVARMLTSLIEAAP
jgi:lipid-A-disaccharide synthase